MARQPEYRAHVSEGYGEPSGIQPLIARQPGYRGHFSDGYGEPSGILPLTKRTAADRGRDGSRSAIQAIALEHRRRYGYRRITAELHRRGMQVNHKRVGGVRREDNLLGLQPQRFKVTTDSNHKFEVYLNLAARMKLSGINQLWVADITYIRLKAEFVYLAVILDGF